MPNNTPAEIRFSAFRDDYRRSCHSVIVDGVLVGVIARLPKATFPTPTFLVNDYRVTRSLMGTPAYTEAIVHVGSLREAKALFAA